MEGQRERTSSRRRQRRKSKSARGKVVVEPVLIAARRPDSPRLENGFRNVVVASAQPKGYITASPAPAAEKGHPLNGTSRPDGAGSSAHGHAEDGEEFERHAVDAPAASNGAAEAASASTGVRRRAVRIVKLTDNALTPGNREQQLLDRLVRSQGRGAISRAADDLWESKFVAPKRQEIQIQLLEHENETRARDAVFAMAELLQREAPIKRPVLDQRLRRLETSAEDPITRDAAGALRRSMRVHHGL
jgi:hypothetical protein